MKIIDNYHELPVSIVFGILAPIYHLTGVHGRESNTTDLAFAAQHIQVYGISFVLTLVAIFCLNNARKVESYGWMKVWNVLLKIWITLTLGSILIWLPQIF